MGDIHFSQENNKEKTERLKCYFSLLAEQEEEIWVDSKGLSMLPLFYRGVKVQIDPEVEEYDIGNIVVFHRENKYIAHRIVFRDPRNNLFTTKGDTLFFFDGPVRKEEFLGLVKCVRKGQRRIPVGSDKELAQLSQRLGAQLIGKLHWFPDWLKFLYYFFFFIPSYAMLSLVRVIKQPKRQSH